MQRSPVDILMRGRYDLDAVTVVLVGRDERDAILPRLRLSAVRIADTFEETQLDKLGNSLRI